MSTSTTRLGLVKAAGGEKYSRLLTNNNLDTIDALAIAMDKLPKGLVYQKHVTGSTGAVLDAIVENIPSFTFTAGRKYRIVWDFSYLMSGNSDSLFYCSICLAPVADAAALLTNLTVLEGRTKFVQTFVGASTGSTGPVVSYHIEDTNRTTQLKFRVQRVYGDDSITIVANNNERAIYSIYDDGAADGTFS